MVLPRVFRLKQRLEGPTLRDIPAAVRESLRSLRLQDRVKPRETVAITSGSRGIANIDRITRVVVDEVKSLGLTPFIVPAMGSHGGATTEGQLKVLEHYGVTESAMGCPIRSGMDVVEVGRTKGTTVFCDKNAWEADHIAVVGRRQCPPGFQWRHRERAIQDDGDRTWESSVGRRTTIEPDKNTAMPRYSRWWGGRFSRPGTFYLGWELFRTVTARQPM